jgi:hypothetical protein
VCDNFDTTEFSFIDEGHSLTYKTNIADLISNTAPNAEAPTRGKTSTGWKEFKEGPVNQQVDSGAKITIKAVTTFQQRSI